MSIQQNGVAYLLLFIRVTVHVSVVSTVTDTLTLTTSHRYTVAKT
jgi:hypothetical protein